MVGAGWSGAGSREQLELETTILCCGTGHVEGGASGCFFFADSSTKQIFLGARMR